MNKTFITVGERKMTTFASFHGSCQTREESRQSENGMTHQRIAFRSNCLYLGFPKKFLKSYHTWEYRDSKCTGAFN